MDKAELSTLTDDQLVVRADSCNRYIAKQRENEKRNTLIGAAFLTIGGYMMFYVLTIAISRLSVLELLSLS